MRVTVIGAEIIGLSSAWALARRGHTVTVLEQYGIPNPLGSSVDQHRLIRYAYGGMAGYAAMVGPAYAAWDRLWGDLGRTHYVEIGTLAIGGGDHEWLTQSAATLEAAGVDIGWLSMAELERRFPLLRSDGLELAFHLPTGGILLADRIVEGLAGHLRRLGVEIRTEARVTAVDPDRAAATLADGTTIEADRIIVAAGPWVTTLRPELAARVTSSRQVVCYLKPPAEQAAAWAVMPMVLDIDPMRGFYTVPPVAGTGMKVGDHSFSLTGHPDRDREAASDEADALLDACRSRFANFSGFEVDRLKTCFYTVEKEEKFVVEPLGDRGWAMTGFSGHGFKFGPLLGERMAETLEGARDPAAFTRWSAGEAA